jgi:pimeloyl-ACP methyl ester carboxylesterase
MSKIFLIPGLGADYRAYKDIDLQGYDVVLISWVEPEKNDTLSSYAQKLMDRYQITAGSIVIGNSLGGMLTMEIAKKIKLNKAILISSIKTVDEALKSFWWYRHIPLYKLIPAKIYTSSGFLVRFVMGKISKKNSALFIDMLRKTSPRFAKWAIGAIMHWDNRTIPENVYHIHGDKDLMFPYQRIKDATIIEGGTHIMIMTRAKDINQWLKNILPL